MTSNNSQGIVLVSKSFGSISQSVGNQVVVQFYVNQVGYCFDTTLQDSSMGLALVIPKKINRVKSCALTKPQSFRARLFYLDEKSMTLYIYLLDELRDYIKRNKGVIPYRSLDDGYKRVYGYCLNKDLVRKQVIERNEVC